MANQFILPDPGEGIHEAEILEVYVSVGDVVEEGDIILHIETDKAAVEVPSPYTGVVEEIRVKQGDIVLVGEVLMTFSEETGKDTSRKKSPPPKQEDAGEHERDQAKTVAKDRTETVEEDRVPEEAAQAETEKREKRATTPAAEQETRETKKEEHRERKEKEAQDKPGEEEKAKREEERETGTEAAAEVSPKSQARPREATTEIQAKRPTGGPVPASPATRRLARELHVDLRAVAGSGPGGRVTAEDVRADADVEKKAPATEKPEEKVETVVARPVGEREATGPAAPTQKPPRPLVEGAPPLPDFSRWGPVEHVPLRGIRRATARHMALAWSQIPHVTHQDIADITKLDAFRRRHREAIEKQGGKLSLTVFVMRAVVAALKQFPRFNASLDPAAGEIILKRYYHIGVAVDTEQGLIVPVLRDVDRKSLTELATQLPQLAERMRQGKATPEEMRGGTFTITNPGPLGGTAFTPIINYPEVAILGVARARLDPMVEGDLEQFTIAPRLRLPLHLTFDHRVNDGADAARFMGVIIDILSDPEAFMLNL